MRWLYRSLSVLAFITVPLTAWAAGGFTLSSPDFANGGTIPMAQVLKGHGCTGQNISPALHWSGAPADTKSFAVTIYDPDARGGWWHWLVFNIPAGTTGLPANAGAANSRALPAGTVQGKTSFGFSHYGGPCPPVGDAPHHYQITVYALKVGKLPLGADATSAKLAHYLRTETIAKTYFTALYGRSK